MQELITPVPAALESENAGFRSSISSYRKNSTPVANLAGADGNVTGYSFDMENITENPFRRNSGIQRSPPTSMSKDIPIATDAQTSDSLDHSPLSNTFEELGALIGKLMEYVKSKNNVHHAIKEQIRAIKAKYNKAKEDLNAGENKQYAAGTERSTQTSPSVGKNSSDLKRNREQLDSPIKIQTPKRRKQGNTMSKKSKEKPREVVAQAANKEEGEDWKMVKSRKRWKKPTRTDAMFISRKGETTYADILRKIKTDPNLQDLGESVSRIRRTQKGDLLLEIKASSKDTVEKFHEMVEQSIGSQAEIRTHKQEVRIEVRDMDEVTTKEEICTALINQFGANDIKETDIKSLRRSYGDTQSAVVSLPIGIGRKALMVGKIRIGWVICRIREQVTLKKCYRCLEFGHFASKCTNTQDRSNMCRRCGETGHIAKNCTNKPECMLCKHLEYTDVNHVAGSGRCMVFKKALNKTRK